jgi:hypothetical protein
VLILAGVAAVKLGEPRPEATRTAISAD